jgi:hypothetical protein
MLQWSSIMLLLLLLLPCWHLLLSVLLLFTCYPSAQADAEASRGRDCEVPLSYRGTNAG